MAKKAEQIKKTLKNAAKIVGGVVLNTGTKPGVGALIKKAEKKAPSATQRALNAGYGPVSSNTLAKKVQASNAKMAAESAPKKSATPTKKSSTSGAGKQAAKKITKTSATSSLPTVKKPSANNKKFYQYK